jgi:SAM-dependent methyltransferase
MLLDRTYKDPEIHSSWRSVYRLDPAQARIDDALYDWLITLTRAEGTRWLDAGCGTGERAVRLAMRGSQVTAIDLSEHALTTARQTAANAGVSSNIRFERAALEEEMSGRFEVDHVHCRGVLMHIPSWREAIRNLAQQVKPGGYFVLVEGNKKSVEAGVVRLVRKLIPAKSRMLKTDSGLEFWSEVNGNAFLARMFDLDVVSAELNRAGLELFQQKSLFLIDPNRAPGALRSVLGSVNRLWFQLNAPLAAGVVLVYRKRQA